MKPKPPAQGTLVQRVIHAIRRKVPPSAPPAGPAEEQLPNAGCRSGEGAASAARYLDEARNTRPSPLE